MNPQGTPDSELNVSLRRKMHKTIHAVGAGIEAFTFNTAIAHLMEFAGLMNSLRANAKIERETWDEAIRNLVLMLAPFVPHLAEELWESLGHRTSVHCQAWPMFDRQTASEGRSSLIVQVNGKMMDIIEVTEGITESEARTRALQSEAVRRFLGEKEPARVIYVQRRLINFVIRNV